MQRRKTRLVIYATDVEIITGRNIRTCYEILDKIRVHFGKKKRDLVTIREFSEFTKIPEELVRDLLDP